MRGNWQDFNGHDASRGPSAIAELLVILDLPLAVADFEFRNGNITEAEDFGSRPRPRT